MRQELRRKLHLPSLYTIHFTLYTKTNEFMKKSYIAPQTEAIQLLAENAIMMASPEGLNLNGMYGNGTGGGSR